MNLEIRYSPPNQSRQVVPVRDRLMIGSLLSNEVVIRAAGVEPIHAMIEVLENGVHMLTDLGSQSGVQLNSKRVDVETPIKIGDKITIGNVLIEVFAYQASAVAQFQRAENEQTRAGDMNSSNRDRKMAQPPPKHDYDSDHGDEDDESHDNPRMTVRSDPTQHGRGSDEGELLFSPRNAKPAGNVLECVAYWEDTVLEADMFHPKIKNNERVTIGVPGKAHFLAGGKEDIKRHKLASVDKEGFTVHLLPDMTARLRKGGRVIEESGEKSLDMSKNDIVHINHGAIKYFLMFIKPPVLDLPRASARDPFFMGLLALSFFLYVAIIPAVLLSKGPLDDKDNDDIWSIVNSPEKKELPKPIPKPKQEIAKVEKEPPPKVEPPKPPPKPPTPVPPEAKPKPVEKPEQVKPVEKPVEKPVQALATPVPPTPVATPKPAVTPPKAPTPNENSAKAGMVSTNTSPDFKNPGKVSPNKAQGLSGGEKGGGKVNNNAGGQRKGNEQNDLMGAEGGAKNKASGVNLGKLGLGAGKVLNKTGAGAIATDFKDSAGGAGGGAGSGAKTYGLGGPGAGKTLGVSGTGGATNNFGGFGGNGSGAGGAGGLGGEGLGSGFGRGTGKGGSGRANVDVPPGDPVVSGGLTTQEVQAVIRANLNQIRHCYEQLLQRQPNANGKIKVAFIIGADGRVTTSSIQSDTIGDSVMAGCVTGKITRWKFPNPRGGVNVNVNYPFVFNPL